MLKLQAIFKKYQLRFTTPVLTSRGKMEVKNGNYILISDGTKTGIGECSFIEGLSIDPMDTYEQVLQNAIDQFNVGAGYLTGLTPYPSIIFGFETALLDYNNGGNRILFESDFTKGNKGVAINGLVWMGSKDFMQQQIEQKLTQGFNCIKIKVGAIDFAEEIALLRFIRQKFPPHVVEIRLDANGAFNAGNVFEKLEALAKFNIHSIEQPVKPGQTELMRQVCAANIIPVALDEELIAAQLAKEQLLQAIKPQYIILKPSLLGGFAACNEWIKEAEQINIKWWATSALESNIGLNAIAQWVFTKQTGMVQGLGTGGLYTNNISSPLAISNGRLFYRPNVNWGIID